MEKNSTMEFSCTLKRKTILNKLALDNFVCKRKMNENNDSITKNKLFLTSIKKIASFVGTFVTEEFRVFF